MAQNMSTSPAVSDRVAACKLAKTSLWMSVVGLVVGTIVLIVVIILAVHFTDKVKQEMMHQCNLKGGHFDYSTNRCNY